MKKLFSYILILISSTALLISCTDDTFNGDNTLANGQIGLKLALNLPSGGSASTRTGGTDAETGTENGVKYENWLQTNDIRLLMFINDIFAEEVTKLQITGVQGSSVRYLEGTTDNPYEGNIKVVVLANLKSRSVAPNSALFVGKTVEQVYKLLEYSYGEDTWELNEDESVPMWGSLNMYLQKGKVNNGNIDLYRAIAKVNILVNKGQGLDNFKLRSIRVYYANTKGYCAALPSDATPESAEIQFTKTSIPATSTQRGVSTPLSYTLEEGAKTFENQIYIPESNNKKPGENKKPLCLVVGGVYAGEGLVEPGAESYYRIDFKDDLESGDKGDLRTYDIIRNHSYVFNIRSVSRPGTPTPEEALDNVVVGMSVQIEEWANVPMRGIPDQYTLTTDKSIVSFDNKISDGTILVTTDYGMDNGSTENGAWEIVEKSNDTWFTVQKEDDNKTIHIEAVENYGVSRQGSFYIQTGNLKKQIIVKQEQPATANSYPVGDGEHELIVIIKGNGNKGLVAEGVQLDDDASIKPDKIGIIWETKEGLVKLIDAESQREVSGGSFAQYDRGKGTIKYKVNTTGATIPTCGGKPSVTGGNALIGAFSATGEVLWSWHIWVCPDIIDATTGKVNDSYLEDWTLNGYKVMDRNLGAVSNSPGVASMGLLYQWGRKDPFIGAGYTNDNFSGKGILEYKYYTYPKVSNDFGVTNYQGNKGIDAINETIAQPTTLIYRKSSSYNSLAEGLSTLAGTRGGYLWGTNGGFKPEIKDLGNKTIYDPCPEGYRTPPVDAFVFTTNERKIMIISNWTSLENKTLKNVYIQWRKDKSSSPTNYVYKESVNPKNDSPDSRYTQYRIASIGIDTNKKSSQGQNWNENLIYIPHNVDGYAHSTDDLYRFTGNYVKNALYYGFYLNYKEIDKPLIKGGNYLDKLNGDNDMYTLDQSYLAKHPTVTWLPLSGAYDPTKGFSFKNDNGTTISIEQGSSITVNSFLWTNSSVDVIESQGTRNIPGAMFLHGTETGGGGSGRHIHGLTKSDIKAEPHYAGAVRCVRDVKKDFSESNLTPKAVSLGSNVGASTESSITSINDSWMIIDGGAPWFKISPDRGTFDKGKGQPITFTALQPNNTGSTRTATVLLQFSSETKPRKIVVSQARSY